MHARQAKRNQSVEQVRSDGPRSCTANACISAVATSCDILAGASAITLVFRGVGGVSPRHGLLLYVPRALYAAVPQTVFLRASADILMFFVLMIRACSLCYMGPERAPQMVRKQRTAAC
jgi:hypothetical protein